MILVTIAGWMQWIWRVMADGSNIDHLPPKHNYLHAALSLNASDRGNEGRDIR